MNNIHTPGRITRADVDAGTIEGGGVHVEVVAEVGIGIDAAGAANAEAAYVGFEEDGCCGIDTL